MGELNINYHDFKKAKEGLKKFSEGGVEELGLDKVNNEKDIQERIFGFIVEGDWGRQHKVTGLELNRLISQLQKYIKKFNDTQVNIIKEFGQVYNALDALDKDYIHAILIAIKSAEETSMGVAKVNDEIKRIVVYQKKTLEELKKYKNTLSSYNHLKDIDEMWDSLLCVEDSLKLINADINKLKKYNDILSSYDHLKDIDEMWGTLSCVQNSLKLINIDMNMCKEEIKSISHLKMYQEKVESIYHLKDIDEMWIDIENYRFKINDLEKENKELSKTIKDNEIKINKKLDDDVQKRDSTIYNMKIQIKYLYIIAGTSLGVALISLVLLLGL